MELQGLQIFEFTMYKKSGSNKISKTNLSSSEKLPSQTSLRMSYVHLIVLYIYMQCTTHLPSRAACSWPLEISKCLGDSGHNGSKTICKIEGKTATPSKY